jgi:DDB1- and CUL4-associated factor 13
MKIKTINRSEADQNSFGLQKIQRNPDPKLHPFEKAREYTRAIRAVKLDRLFAKPFVGAMDDHSDGITCASVSPTALSQYVSGAANGEVIVWDLASQRSLWTVYAHAGFVRGLTVGMDGRQFLSCGDDRTVKLWTMASHESIAGGALEDVEARVGKRRKRRLSNDDSSSSMPMAFNNDVRGEVGRNNGGGGGLSSTHVAPVSVWNGTKPFMYIDHHWSEKKFATSSSSVDIWDYLRSDPIHNYSWGAETVTTVRFNPADPSLFASTANDRSVVLYDLRAESPLQKVVMAMNSNALAWNPREPMNFTIASEDWNCYTFDMRKLDIAMMVHKDHAGAVMDIHYSPTGREFVSGSYDRTVRIFRVDNSRSREVYHTSRMQRVFSVRFTGDAKYIVSGSDDANVRIWKARASEPLGRLLPRERASLDYSNALKRKYAHMPEIKRISQQRHVPKVIDNARVRRFEEGQRERKKLENVRAHTKADNPAGIPIAERKKGIVQVMK